MRLSRRPTRPTDPRRARPARSARSARLQLVGLVALLPVVSAVAVSAGQHAPADDATKARSAAVTASSSPSGSAQAPDLPEVDPPPVRVNKVGMVPRPPGADAVDPPPGVDAAPTSLQVRHTSPTIFKAVAVTWAPRTEDEEVTLYVRVRLSPAKPWSGWLDADGDGATTDDRDGSIAAESVGQGQTRPAQRGGSEMIWTGQARQVEALLITTGEHPPGDVRFEMIDPGTSDTDRAASRLGGKGGGAGGGVTDGVPRKVPAAEPTIYATLFGSPKAPVIATRKQWGADERKMTWPPSLRSPVKAVVFHHAASSNNYSAGDVPGILRSIYQYQAVSRGWGDVGYNVMVDKFGRLWEGRAGGAAQPVVGAHAGGFNAGTAGICVLGDFSSLTVPAAAVKAAAHFASWKLDKYGVNPAGSTKITGGPSTKYPANSTLTVPVIFPHRQTSSTACPGEGGMRVLAEMRRQAAARAF